MYKFTDKEADIGRTATTIFLSFFFIILYLGSLGFGQQLELAEILKGCNQAVVTIIACDANNKEICQGKGVLVSAEGLVLTNYHLISRAISAKVRLPARKIQKKVDSSEMVSLLNPAGEKTRGGPEKKAKGKMVNVEGVVSVDRNLNFALLKIKSKANYNLAYAYDMSNQFGLAAEINKRLIKKKNYQNALESFQKALALRPNWAQAHYNLGIAYYVVKDRFSATEEYNKLKALDSTLAAQLYKIINK